MQANGLKIFYVKCHEDAIVPVYEKHGDAACSLRVVEDYVVRPGERVLAKTGLKIAIPEGFEAQIRPRSGLALKHGIGMVNSPGTIDSDYRGEIGIIVINWGRKSFTIRRGDRVAQMIITRVYQADIMEVALLDSTERGEGGFGHSGVT